MATQRDVEVLDIDVASDDEPENTQPRLGTHNKLALASSGGALVEEVDYMDARFERLEKLSQNLMEAM